MGVNLSSDKGRLLSDNYQQSWRADLPPRLPRQPQQAIRERLPRSRWHISWVGLRPSISNPSSRPTLQD